MRRAAVLACLSLLMACGSPSAESDAGAAPADVRTAPVPDAPRLGVVTHTVEISRLAVPRDSEATVCLNIAAGITETSLLVGIRTHLTEGSHHLIVSRADDVTPSGVPYLCSPFRHGLGDTIFIAQQPEAGIVYPEGAGLPIRAGQPFGLELHFINYVSDTPLDIMGTVEFDIIPLPASYREVHVAFTGNFSLELPPRTETTEAYNYMPGVGAEIIAITSHTHQLGVLSTIDLVTPAATTRIHESRSWADPPLDVFSPPIAIGVSDRLALECTYMNTSDGTVYFGENFDDEMCFLWAYYLDPV